MLRRQPKKIRMNAGLSTTINDKPKLSVKAKLAFAACFVFVVAIVWMLN